MDSFKTIREKQDACYHKIKATAKVWPSAYASGRLVQCRKRGAANYGNGAKTEEAEPQQEDLRQWFKDKWVRFGPDGKIRGDCARDSESEGKPKCLPQSKAHALGKTGRAQAAARKRRQDPDANRRGAAINVKTEDINFMQSDKSFKKIREACWKGYEKKGTKLMFGKRYPNCVPVKETKDKQEYDYEGDMARSQLRSIIANAQAVHDMLEPDTNMAEWVQSKITLAADYISTAADYMQSERNEVNEAAPAWTRKEGKSPSGGLNAKGIASYRRANPGSKLSMAVTTPPSKLDPDGKAAGRRRSFCARMGGSKGPMKDEKGEPTRKALALRKWNC